MRVLALLDTHELAVPAVRVPDVPAGINNDAARLAICERHRPFRPFSFFGLIAAYLIADKLGDVDHAGAVRGDGVNAALGMRQRNELTLPERLRVNVADFVRVPFRIPDESLRIYCQPARPGFGGRRRVFCDDSGLDR